MVLKPLRRHLHVQLPLGCLRSLSPVSCRARERLVCKWLDETHWSWSALLPLPPPFPSAEASGEERGSSQAQALVGATVSADLFPVETQSK